MTQRNLIFSDCVKIGHDIWFSSLNYNGLYKYNIKEKQTEWIAYFPNEMKTKKWLFKSIKLWEDKLVFVPYYAEAVYLYDIKGKFFTVINIMNIALLKKYKNVNKFECCGMYENKLYLIGCGYPGVLKINLDTSEVVELDIFPKRMLKESNNGSFFGSSAVADKNILYFTCCSTNEIIQFDMKTEKVNIKMVGNTNNRYRNIFKGNNGYYLSVYDNDNIIHWNIEDNFAIEINVAFNKHYCGRGLCETERFLWIICLVSNEICRVDKKDNSLIKLYYDDKLRIEDFFCSYKDKVVFIDSNSGRWFEIHEDGKIVDMQLAIVDPRAENDISLMIEDDMGCLLQQPILESECINIKVCFTHLLNSQIQIKTQKKCSAKGEMIHNNINNCKGCI